MKQSSEEAVMQITPRQKLKRWIKGLSILAVVIVSYVLIDFSFNQVSDLPTHRFQLTTLAENKPQLLRNDSLMVVVARYDTTMLQQLSSKGRLSRISESFRQPQPRVDDQGYFVVRAYGSDKGCPLKIVEQGFQESCSDARYDLLGRSMNPQAYADLEIPAYTFSQNHSILTLN